MLAEADLDFTAGAAGFDSAAPVGALRVLAEGFADLEDVDEF